MAAIEYSIYAVDPCWPGEAAIIGGHEAVALDARDVVFDALQNGDVWTVDEVGYNFRHEIEFSLSDLFPKADAQYQVCYELTPPIGQKTIVRFQLKVI